jgi:hypothetical protein
MLRCPRIHVPMRVNGIGLSVPLGLRRRRGAISLGGLTRIVACIPAIIAKPKKALLEATMTLGRPMAIKTAELADPPPPPLPGSVEGGAVADEDGAGPLPDVGAPDAGELTL